MKATLALLTDREIENRVNQIAWKVHRRWHTGVQPRCLPAHVSLKQPFDIGDNLDALERYQAAFAASVAPFDVTLDGFYVWETVFGVTVRETPPLRALHDRLHRELPPLFGNVTAPFDGDDYRFHLTLATGGATRAAYAEIEAAYRSGTFPPSFVAREVASFVYAQSPDGVWEYMVHTVLPLTGG